MAEDTIRRRAACDRCHSQKIRCPRKPGQDVCDRCMKARTPCIFSPFRQKKLPEADGEADDGIGVSPYRSSNEQQGDTARSSTGVGGRKRQRMPSPQTQTQESINLDQSLSFGGSSVQTDVAPADGQINWMTNSFSLSEVFPDSTFDDLNLAGQTPFSPMDFNSPMAGTQPNPPHSPKTNNRVQSLNEANINRTIKATSNIADSLPPEPSFRDLVGTSTRWGQTFEILEPDSKSNCIRKLSQLSIDLFEHRNTVPPLLPGEPSPGDNPVSCQDYSKYRVDETFRLTQSLVDIYPSFLNAFLPHPTSQSSGANPTWSSDWTSNSYFETGQHPSTSSTCSSQSSTLQDLDHSSILLMLGCHLRLISTYEALFHHMRACVVQGGVARPPQQATLDVPPLKIGSFAPPPSAAIPMQMLLLVQFATRLSNYATELASEIGGSEQGTPQSESSSGNSADDTLALTRAAVENVKHRASNMSQELAAMRILILQSGHLA